MPNWCSNTATFEHNNPVMIQRLVNAYNTGKTFSEFFPTPSDLLEEVEHAGEDYNQRREALRQRNMDKHGYADWYQWNIDHWGTKWDFGGDGFEAEASDDGKSVFLSFSTAWSPPITFYQEMEDELGFRITATYFEPGMSFVGEYADGSDDVFEIDPADFSNIPENLREDYDIESWFEQDEEEEPEEQDEETK